MNNQLDCSYTAKIPVSSQFEGKLSKVSMYFFYIDAMKFS